MTVLQAISRWGYYPLILIGSWFFATVNRIHDFIEPDHKIFWLSVLDVGMAALMVSISNKYMHPVENLFIQAPGLYASNFEICTA